LKLTTKPKNPGAGFHVRLENAPRNAQADDGSEQKVADIVTVDRLQHASLAVFHDIVGEPIPLFPAEWDQLAASDEASRHAQPHWHFVQSPQRIGEIARTLMKPPGETSEFSSEQSTELFSDVVDFGKFHFAMTSMWEKNETPPYKKRLFGSSDFPKWFRSLTNYIAGQIAYLVSHMP